MNTDRPDDLPAYLADSIEKYKDDDDVLAAVEEFAQELKSAADTAPDRDEIYAEADGNVVDVREGDGGGTLVEKKVTCGDESCKCADGDLHGPYVYRVKRDGDSLTWEYIGKKVDAPDGAAQSASD